MYAWTAPTANPPAGNVSAPINTSATAQTKAGWLRAVGGNGGDPASRIGVGNNWWMSENTNGNYAIHRNGVGDKLTMDTNGNVGLAGGLSLPAGSTITGGGANSNYGSLTVNGSKNGWAGINFPGAGTVMMHPSYSGFYNSSDSNWRMYVTDAGNVYANDYYSNVSGKWASAAQSRVTGSCAVGQAITAIAADGTVTCKAATGTQASSAWSDFVGRRTTAQNIYGWVSNVTDYYYVVTATTLETHQVTNGVDTLLYTACDTTKTQNTANSPLVSTGMTGALSCHVLYGGAWYNWQLTPVGIREYGAGNYYFWPWQ